MSKNTADVEFLWVDKYRSIRHRSIQKKGTEAEAINYHGGQLGTSFKNFRPAETQRVIPILVSPAGEVSCDHSFGFEISSRSQGWAYATKITVEV